MTTKILFVIDGLEFGGGERVFAQIIAGLPLDRYTAYLASAPNDAFLSACGHDRVTFLPIDFSRRCHVANLGKLLQIIRDHGINIVHGQGGRADFFARLAAALSPKTRCVSTIAMPVEGYDVPGWKRRLYTVLDRWSERFVHRFLVVSEVLRNTMIEEHRVPPEKVVKIYNGIETEHFRPDDGNSGRHRLREVFGTGPTGILVGSLGRLVWQKGLCHFLTAMPLIRHAFPQVRFVIVGEGNLRHDLETRAAELGMANHLVFAGQRRDIRDCLAAMDIVVIPSLLEGFPMVTLEAMAMGKPLVATAIAGMTEQIVDGREGLLVPPENPQAIASAVANLVQNAAAADRMGKNARERVLKNFSIKTMITSTLEVYDNL